MPEKLDTWGRWKREAIQDYEEAGWRSLRSRSKPELMADALEKQLPFMPAWKRTAIKGAALMGKVTRHADALAAGMGREAAELAPDTWKGVAFDLGTLAIGSVAKLAKLTKLAEFGHVPLKPTTYRALQELHQAAGYPEIANRMARTRKLQKLAKAAHVVDETADAVHSAYLGGTAIAKVTSTPTVAPRKFAGVRPVQPGKPPFARGPVGPIARVGAATFRQPVLSRSAIGEIMQKGVYVPGVWGTEATRRGSRPAGFDASRFKQPALSKQTEREIMRKGVYVPGVWGMEVTRSWPGHQQPSLSDRTMNEIMRKGVYVPGVWGQEVTRSRPGGFDINRLQQPKLSSMAEREIMRKGVFVPGVWGMEVHRSR